MIYTFRIVSDEVDNFKREIQIDADATFLDLRNIICDSVGYDKGEMSSFFMCDRNWEREQEITLEDMTDDSAQEVYLMEETPLSDFIEEEGQRLTWVYDYLTERCFFIEMKKLQTGKNLHDPICSLSMGKAPKQLIDIEEFNRQADSKAAAKAEETTELDNEFYGSESYNEDEFDADGYDELNLD